VRDTEPFSRIGGIFASEQGGVSTAAGFFSVFSGVASVKNKLKNSQETIMAVETHFK
jgi:hypothetical protein